MVERKQLWWGIGAAALVVYCATVFVMVDRHTAAGRAQGDYVAINGGGFVFNYRIADIKAGLTVSAQKPLPDGAVLVVELVYPDGARVPMREIRRPQPFTYLFETGHLRTIAADTVYVAEVALVDSGSGAVLERHDKDMVSGIAPRHMPRQALTIGPGYFPNPDR